VLLIKYYSGNQIEKNEMGEHVASMGEMRDIQYIQGFGGET
jgi:hypothetical protein